MTFLVPETQVAPTFSGTFVGYTTGSLVGPFSILSGGDYLSIAVTGSVAYLQSETMRLPLGKATGTVAMTYTANLGVDVYEGISGCFCDVNIEVRRTYLVLATINWKWSSTNWAVTKYGLWANGSSTGIVAHGVWQDGTDSNANTTEYKFRTVMFILPNWNPGAYRFQLVHTPNNAQQDRYIYRAAMAVF